MTTSHRFGLNPTMTVPATIAATPITLSKARSLEGHPWSGMTSKAARHARRGVCSPSGVFCPECWQRETRPRYQANLMTAGSRSPSPSFNRSLTPSDPAALRWIQAPNRSRAQGPKGTAGEDAPSDPGAARGV